MTDIPKLIGELKRAGDGWSGAYKDDFTGLLDVISTLRGMCRQAAAALEEQQAAPTKEITDRLGDVMIALGRKLKGE